MLLVALIFPIYCLVLTNNKNDLIKKLYKKETTKNKQIVNLGKVLYQGLFPGSNICNTIYSKHICFDNFN